MDMRVYAYKGQSPFIYATAAFTRIAKVGGKVDALLVTPATGEMELVRLPVSRLSRTLPRLGGDEVCGFIKRCKLRHRHRVTAFARKDGKGVARMVALPRNWKDSMTPEQAFATMVFLTTGDRIGQAASPPKKIGSKTRRKYAAVVRDAAGPGDDLSTKANATRSKPAGKSKTKAKGAAQPERSGKAQAGKCKAKGKTGLDSAGAERVLREELNGLVGLQPFRDHLTSIALFAVAARKHAAVTGHRPAHCLHAALVGPSGTGKTESARRLGSLLHRLGLSRKPTMTAIHARELVGAHIGSTAPLVRKVVAKALGGVLFLDESGALLSGNCQQDYGLEAISTLIELMEKHRDDLVVVFAGYQESIDRLLDSNPGLRSRVPTVIPFERLDHRQAFEVLLGFAETDCVRVEPGVAQMYERLATFLKMPTTGRAVRCFWEELKYGAVARRHACTGGQMRLVPADLEEVKWSIAPWLRGAGGYLDVSALSGAYN